MEHVFGVRISLCAWHFERQGGARVDRGLKLCAVCGRFGCAPFPECRHCGASPSWHHSRCCPQAPAPEGRARGGAPTCADATATRSDIPRGDRDVMSTRADMTRQPKKFKLFQRQPGDE